MKNNNHDEKYKDLYDNILWYINNRLILGASHEDVIKILKEIIKLLEDQTKSETGD